ncbi:MAG: hypothetical protein M5T61_21495 [Acidimicrobiia bacterium]|nr:hypothetical protein [Acidimicrobiia bacterium]
MRADDDRFEEGHPVLRGRESLFDVIGEVRTSRRPRPLRGGGLHGELSHASRGMAMANFTPAKSKLLSADLDLNSHDIRVAS